MNLTAKERAELDRHARGIAQAQAAGITGLRDALLANA